MKVYPQFTNPLLERIHQKLSYNETIFCFHVVEMFLVNWFYLFNCGRLNNLLVTG